MRKYVDIRRIKPGDEIVYTTAHPNGHGGLLREIIKVAEIVGTRRGFHTSATLRYFRDPNGREHGLYMHPPYNRRRYTKVEIVDRN